MFKQIFNVVGVIAIATTLLTGCVLDPDGVVGGMGSGRGNDINAYRTVTIGTQTWMAENLDYAIAGSVCYDSLKSNCDKYGRLYTLDAAMRACPIGWHLPSIYEWDTLGKYVGLSTAGTKLKSTSGWNSYEGKSGNGTDEYGFSALPGGLSAYSYSFYNAGNDGLWWSASDWQSSHEWAHVSVMSSSVDRYGMGQEPKTYMVSVRCVVD